MPLYRVSQKAKYDLRHVGLYTEREWGRLQRRKYLNALDEIFGLLAENPRLAPEHYEFTPPVRIHHHEQHLVVYVIEDNGIG